MPKTIKPQLATLVSEPPQGDGWLHELKFDGYRILARCDDKVRLFTRRGNDWTDRFPAVVHALGKLNLRGTMLDGEVVVLDPQGRSDFQALQNMLNSSEPRKLIYYVFDVPYASGFDLSRTPQIDRKEILRQLLSSQKSESLIRFSDHIRGQGSNVADLACQHALEGVVCKRVDAPYEQCRSR
ncbi:MAG: hypothetical protein RJP95_00255, partial [Pirellulales bacterium]